MRGKTDSYVEKVRKNNILQSNLRQMLMILSFLVVLAVFWGLKLTGITMAGEAFCGKKEHVHDENCPLQTIICGLEEEERHIHNESCILRELICELEEQEGHAHTSDCVNRELNCTLEEIEGHTHVEECYVRELFCTSEEEGHVHEEGCYEKQLCCELEEQEGHTHDDACYIIEETNYICGLEEIEAHAHGDNCYLIEDGYCCGLEETEGHLHTDECYDTLEVCPYEEHVHDKTCYSDLEADLEEEDDWEMMLEDTARSFLLSENVVAVAESQLGYEESVRNFKVGKDGIRRGITRYGQWYGNPYGDWSAMFVSFCLHYAGMEDAPISAGAEAMRQEWKDAGKYAGISEFAPQIGNVLFLHKEYEEELDEKEIVLRDPIRKPDLSPATPSDADKVLETETPEAATPSDAEKVEETETLLPATPSDAEKVAEIENPEAATPSDAEKIETSEAESEIESEIQIEPEDVQSDTEQNPTADAAPMGLNDAPESIVVTAVETEDMPTETIVPSMVVYNTSDPENTIPSSVDTAPDTIVVTSADTEDAAVTTDITPIVLEGPPAALEVISKEPDEIQTVELTEIETAVPAVSDMPLAVQEAIANAAEEPAGMPEIVADVPQTMIRTAIRKTEEEDSGIRANAAAIVTGYEDGVLTVIEGDLDGMVEENYYYIDDPALLGYGLVEEPMMMFAAPRAGMRTIAKTSSVDRGQFNASNYYVVYTVKDNNYYAFDGNGNAVPIQIDRNGNIQTDVENPNTLFWSFTRVNNYNYDYYIQNALTGLYMHAYPDNGSGVLTTGKYASNLEGSTNQLRIRSNNSYARLDDSNSEFVVASNSSNAATFRVGVTGKWTVWLDGTQGGLMSLGNAANRSVSVPQNGMIVLPTEWDSSSEYDYKLRGWYDIVHHQYYPPGAQVPITENTVFYADWVAETYDIGEFNAQVADTVSTNDFITARMFDYNALFNILSASVSVNVSESSHSETWTLVRSGTNPSTGKETLDYIFRDWDGERELSYPTNYDSHNTYSADIPVHYNLYNEKLANLLFGTNNSFDPETGEGVIGKQYLGTADHLFQFGSDPNEKYYGYYYYDSELNAASYNQSDERFYVYDYLERTTASESSDGSDKYSDFLPLNSPYANKGNNNPATYTYAGNNDEYLGVTHYMYDADNGDKSNVATNYHFGMSMDVSFYLPNDVGSGKNYDLYGNEMHFKFSGDDDVWVLVDGKLVLDIGGIHGVESGDINFSSGVVTINGEVNQGLTNTLKTIKAGEHVLTFYYLERGSSMSNCAVFFNLAPRFSFSIQKEDVLTRDVLNGAQFSVYTDEACTKEATLWPSKESHDRGDAATNVFTVTDGVANIWGMGASNTYYIKETKPPDREGYGFANGIIKLTFDKSGAASYKVIIIDGGDGISGGFTVHGFRIDEETQQAYIIATNAPEWVEDITSVHVKKIWNDDKEHSGDSITLYLTVMDPDGTVRRLQEVQLEDENNWSHVWENLPKYWEDGVTPIQYGVEEAYVSGYYSKSERVEEYNITSTRWDAVSRFENGKTYILGTSSGYLSTQRQAEDTGYMWVTEQAAKESPLALWTATTSGSNVKLTNGAGQSITFYYNGGSPTDFFAKTGNETDQSKQYFKVQSEANGIRIYYDAPNNRDYYLISSMTSAQKFQYSETRGNGLLFNLKTKVQTSIKEPIDGWGYLVTNTPLEQETSLAVEKHWDYGNMPYGDAHEQAQVTVRLLANGKDTGRTVTLSLKSNWKGTFRGLPYVDGDNQVIQYSIEETWDNDEWFPEYGEIITINGKVPTYSTSVTNKYRKGYGGPILPSTGTAARLLYILCGSSIILLTLVYGIGLRRKRERRKEKDL